MNRLGTLAPAFVLLACSAPQPPPPEQPTPALPSVDDKSDDGDQETADAPADVVTKIPLRHLRELRARFPEGRLYWAAHHGEREGLGYTARFADLRGNWQVEIDHNGHASQPRQIDKCEPRVLAALSAHWKLGGDKKLVPIRCVAFEGGRATRHAAWVWIDASGTAELRRAVLDEEFQVMASEGQEEAAWYRADGFRGSILALDFDGDGELELVESTTLSHDGLRETTLSIYRIKRDALVRILSTKLDLEDNGDTAASTKCVASWSVEQHGDEDGLRLHIEGRVEQGSDADEEVGAECASGKQTWLLKGDGEFYNDGE